MQETGGRKILICTFGSLGDLHPFIALGQALKGQGFAPVVATSAAYRGFVESEGLGFAPVRPDAGDLTTRLGMGMGEIARRMAQDDAFLFETLIFPHLRESYDDLLAASAGAVAVVSHAIAFAGRLVAEARGLPSIPVMLPPMLLYSAYDPPLASRAPIRAPVWPGEAAYNRLLLWALSHAVGLRAAPLRRLRRELELPRRRGFDLLLGFNSSAAILGLFSPLLGPPQPDHPPGTLIAGHSFHDRYEGAAGLPPDLAAFLDAGEPPLVFTLGSFVAHARPEYYAACIGAAQRLGRRGVLLADKDDAAQLRGEAPDGVHIVGYVPHSQIFPRAAAVVHHAGIGTTGQALRAGRPQVATPFLGDQFDNAGRLQRLGVARVVPGEAVKADNLAQALEAALGAPNGAERAALAAAISREDGAAVAARRIAEIIGRP